MLVNYEEKLNEIKENLTNIGNGILNANKLIVDALQGCDQDKLNEAKTYIKNVSKKTNDMDNLIVTTLALHSPEAKDLRTMVSYLKITNELLRASSSTRGFIKGFINLCSEIDIDTIKEYAIPMQKLTVESLQYTMSMVSIDCDDEMQETFNKVLIAENKTDDVYDIFEQSLLKDVIRTSEFEKYHKLLGTLRKSKKIADRAMSIALLLLYANNGGTIHQL